MSDSLKPVRDYGAPASLAMQARRTVEQESLVMTVRGLEREIGRLVRELEKNPDLNKKALFQGEAFLAAGVMLIVNSITREDLFK